MSGKVKILAVVTALAIMTVIVMSSCSMKPTIFTAQEQPEETNV